MSGRNASSRNETADAAAAAAKSAPPASKLRQRPSSASDLKGIMLAPDQIGTKNLKDVQKMEETVSRKTFVKELQKNSNENVVAELEPEDAMVTNQDNFGFMTLDAKAPPSFSFFVPIWSGANMI